MDPPGHFWSQNHHNCIQKESTWNSVRVWHNQKSQESLPCYTICSAQTVKHTLIPSTRRRKHTVNPVPQQWNESLCSVLIFLADIPGKTNQPACSWDWPTPRDQSHFPFSFLFFLSFNDKFVQLLPLRGNCPRVHSKAPLILTSLRMLHDAAVFCLLLFSSAKSVFLLYVTSGSKFSLRSPGI